MIKNNSGFRTEPFYDPDPLNEHFENKRGQIIKRSLDDLKEVSERDFRVIMWFYYKEKSLKFIAKKLKVGIDRTKRIKSKALKKLAKILKGNTAISYD